MTTEEYQEKLTLLQQLRHHWKFLVLNQGKRDKIELIKEQVLKLNNELKDKTMKSCGT